MEKGIIKLVIIVTIISMTLLIGSICLAMRFGGLIMQSVNTSNQTNQNGETGTSNSQN